MRLTNMFFYQLQLALKKYGIEVETSQCADKAQCVLKQYLKMMTLKHDDDDSFIRTFIQTK